MRIRKTVWPQCTEGIGGGKVGTVRLASDVLQQSSPEMVTFWTKVIIMGRERIDLIQGI